MRKIAFVVYPGYSLMALAVVAAFELANQQCEEAFYELSFLSERGGVIRTSSGLPILSEVFGRQEIDTLIVGGGTTLSAPSPELVEFVRRSPTHCRRVASICSGAFVLAEAGLLDGRHATTHWLYTREFRKLYPKVRLEEDRIFVTDGPFWTSAGMSAGIDLGLALIEADLGSEAANDVARKLVLYHRRAGGQSQFSALLDLEPKSDRIRTALVFAKENLHTQLTVDSLAEAANLSPRQFSRVFHSETGCSPAKAIENLRIEAAKELMSTSQHPLEVIARLSGFSDPDRMRRAFLRAYGQPPQVIRRNSRLESRST